MHQRLEQVGTTAIPIERARRPQYRRRSREHWQGGGCVTGKKPHMGWLIDFPLRSWNDNEYL